MNRVEIGFNNASAFHVGGGAFTVEIGIGGGAYAYHIGTGRHSYFNEEQAQSLANKIGMAGSIDPAHWTDGYLNPLKPSDVKPRPKLSFA